MFKITSVTRIALLTGGLNTGLVSIRALGATQPTALLDHRYKMLTKNSLRNFLGELPLAAELDYSLRQKGRARKDHYNLARLHKSLPRDIERIKPILQHPIRSTQYATKNILFFATLHYWIEQAAYISLALAGLGHKVTLLTLPYSEWHKEMDKLTQRQRGLHTRDALSSLAPYVTHASFLDPSTRSGQRKRTPLRRRVKVSISTSNLLARTRK
mgnify:CR=1 FL=1